ncbi:MAG: dTDP-glucose 4,6-dehydratase [Bradyrhizobiaceae bacterium]|nr:MAG: dTDP-glucose 4,6-dehydratase [Bradyrhizobiaceae bacterium]
MSVFQIPDPAASSPILVTGGAGFIGSNFIRLWLARETAPVVNLDKLTYAGNLENFSDLTDRRLEFVRGDIGDVKLVKDLLARIRPRAILNFAAESHVDRSIHGPDDFIATNVVGTFRLLECARDYWQRLDAAEREAFRFLHVSTDEVYGTLAASDPAFSETNAFKPNSPYAASKAASDHLVRAWHHTYGLPVVTTNCSNNYGPYQFPEKLIPLMIHNALSGKPLPVYGDGMQVRDWLHVEDHCEAIRCVLAKGRLGETYNIGGNSEKANIDVVHTLCDILDTERPRADGNSYKEQIAFVKDRPGHDRRYAIDAAKMTGELGWTPKETFETGLLQTVRWYLANPTWTERVISGAYRDWIQKNYSAR